MRPKLSFLGYAFIVLSGMLAANAQDAQILYHLKPNELSAEPSDSSLLKFAYRSYVLLEFDGPPPKWFLDVDSDMIKRQNLAATILLDLFENDPHRLIKPMVLDKVRFCPKLDKTPYLLTARKYLKQSGIFSSEEMFYALCHFFAEFGSREDLALVESTAVLRRPFEYRMVQPILKSYKKRLKTLELSRKDGLQPNVTAIDPSTNGGRQSPIAAKFDNASFAKWGFPSFGVALIVFGALYVLLLVRKGAK